MSGKRNVDRRKSQCIYSANRTQQSSLIRVYCQVIQLDFPHIMQVDSMSCCSRCLYLVDELFDFKKFDTSEDETGRLVFSSSFVSHAK